MATIVEPTGVEARMEMTIPAMAQPTDRTAEQTVTLKKLSYRRIADIAGEITRALISSELIHWLLSVLGFSPTKPNHEVDQLSGDPLKLWYTRPNPMIFFIWLERQAQMKVISL